MSLFNQGMTRAEDAQQLLAYAARAGNAVSASHRLALNLLADDDGLAAFDLGTAVVSGNLARVRQLLAEDPDSASRPLGDKAWVPLLHACFSRLTDGCDTLAIVEALLRSGADPNASFVDEHKCVVTAITALMAAGEMGPHIWPPHPHGVAIAELLLVAGADPNQSQGLYNTMFQSSDQWLQLFLKHGLTAEHWPTYDSEHMTQVLDFQLAWAIANGRLERAKLLLEHSANSNSTDHYDGQCLHVNAQLVGDRGMVELLVKHGATPHSLQGSQLFTAAILRADREQAKQLIKIHPTYLDDEYPLRQASRLGRTASVALLLELGREPDFADEPGGPLQIASWYGHLDLVKILIEHGCDPAVRHPQRGNTPIGAAQYAGYTEVVDYLAQHTHCVLDVIRAGKLERVTQLLDEDPKRLHQTDKEGDGVLACLPPDPAIAAPLASLLLSRGAAPKAKNTNGKTAEDLFLSWGRRDIVKFVAL